MLKGALYDVVEIKEQRSQSFTIKIRLLSDYPIFKGHFPNNPILPGACLVEIVKELLQNILNKEILLKTAANIKFLAVINPEKNPDIHINLEVEQKGNLIHVKSNATFPDGTTNFKFKGTFVQS